MRGMLLRRIRVRCRRLRVFGIGKGSCGGISWSGSVCRQGVSLLVAEFGSDEEETGFENAETGGYWDGVEVLDFECFDFFVFVFNGHLEEIAVFTLEEEEECTLARD